MLITRLFDEKLAQASYMVTSQRLKQALVIDPHRDISLYLDSAAAQHVTITHVTETHIHADFVSGAHDLAEATGAKLYLSGMGGPDWKYASARKWGADLLIDGSTLMVGEVRI